MTPACSLCLQAWLCANCHVEYYFQGAEKYPVFPWEKGTRIEDISAYYQEIGFKDWDYPFRAVIMAENGAPKGKLASSLSEAFSFAFTSTFTKPAASKPAR